MVISMLLLMPSADASHTVECRDVKHSAFTFVFENGTVVSGDNCPGSEYEYPAAGVKKHLEAWFPGTGGSASFPNGPGMQVHVSCSSGFTDGWSDLSDRGPNEIRDPNWRIARFEIYKYSQSNVLLESCEGEFSRSTTTPPSTVPEVTSTTLGENTTTTLENATTSTVAPTTTIDVLGTSITAAPSTTVVVDVTEATLPFTGLENGTTGLFAMLLVGGGLLFLVASRSARE